MFVRCLQTRLPLTRRKPRSSPQDSSSASSRMITFLSTRSNHELDKKLCVMRQQSFFPCTSCNYKSWIAKSICLLNWYKQVGSQNGQTSMSTLELQTFIIRYWLTYSYWLWFCMLTVSSCRSPIGNRKRMASRPFSAGYVCLQRMTTVFSVQQIQSSFCSYASIYFFTRSFATTYHRKHIVWYLRLVLIMIPQGFIEHEVSRRQWWWPPCCIVSP